MRRLQLCPILIGAVMLACSPDLDWREVRPEGSAAILLFPCKPKSQARIATLGASGTAMKMLACNVGGMTFALSHAELGDPARVGAALVEWRLALAANLDASDVRSVPFALAGTTPNPQATRIWLTGRLPDGTPAREQAVLFVRGTRIYQAAILGARIDDAASNIFFDSLRLAT